MTPLPFLDHLIAIAVSTLSLSVLPGMVLAICLALLLRTLPPLPAAARSLLWTAVFALFLVTPFFASFLQGHSSISSPAVPALTLDRHWGLVLVAAWLAFSSYRALRLIHSAMQLHALWRDATPVLGSIVTTRSSFARPSRRAAVCLSDSVSKPIVIGFLTPRILLPATLYAQFSAEELQSILLHETEHLRRRDDWLNLLQKIGLALFALHPALLWVEKRLCLERELACDDSVLRTIGAPKRYASCLVDLAERCVLNRHIGLALGAWGTQSELSRRVQHILHRSNPALGNRRTWPTLAVLTAGIFLGTAAVLHCPQFVILASPALPSIAQTSVHSTFSHPANGMLQTVSYSTPTQRSARMVPVRFSSTYVRPRPQRHALKPITRNVSLSPRRSALAQQRTSSAPHIFATSYDLPSGPKQTAPEPGRLVLTVFTPGSQSSSYAAVPYRNGWLIVQL